jgi:hypothetical protein
MGTVITSFPIEKCLFEKCDATSHGGGIAIVNIGTWETSVRWCKFNICTSGIRSGGIDIEFE